MILRNPLRPPVLHIHCSWNFSDKSQIVCQENIFEISQSSIWLYKKSCEILMILSQIGRFWVNTLFTSHQYFPGAGTFLTSLRLFVKKIFLRSRKAQSDYTKSPKSRKTQNYTQNRVKYWWFCHKFAILSQYTFHLPSVFSWSWNFSDKSQIVCRENIFEISQSSIWLHKNSKKSKTLQTMYKSCKFSIILSRMGRFWLNTLFTSHQYFPGAGTFPTSLRLFVEKIFSRSRRARSDYTKSLKSQKPYTLCTNRVNFW